MGPCQLQMSATLTVVLRNLAAKKTKDSGAATVRRSAGLFALGYVLFYLPVAVILGGTAWALGRYAWVLAVVGGLLAIVLGLAALGVLRRGGVAGGRGGAYPLPGGGGAVPKPVHRGGALRPCVRAGARPLP